MKFKLKYEAFHSWKCIWKCPLPKWRPCCPGEDELTSQPTLGCFTYDLTQPRWQKLAAVTRLHPPVIWQSCILALWYASCTGMGVKAQRQTILSLLQMHQRYHSLLPSYSQLPKGLCVYNSFRPSDIYMHQKPNPSLVQIMACTVFCAKPHYLNQCWNIFNCTLRNKLQWNFNLNSYIFIQENALENGGHFVLAWMC